MATTDPRAKLPDAPLSDNERMKRESNYLHGTISADLGDGMTGGFRGDNFQLIRFHGMYEQDDRDIRQERIEEKLEPLKNIMLRCRLPGGVMTPAQWLAIDEFARENTLYGTIRLTNRQTFQFHGVLKPHIKPMHEMLVELGLDGIAASGDVNRNTMCTSNPVESTLQKEAYDWAVKISEYLLPKTTAYADIWVNGEKLKSTHMQPDAPIRDAVKSGDSVEPINGKTYLPRKFKTTVVIPPRNDVDVHANDLNFVAIAENGKLIGFDVLVGGGLAMTHGDHSTWPNLAKPFGFVRLDQVLDCAAAVVSVQRDWGNRSVRKNARTRYTLERVGVDVFKAEVEARMGSQFAPMRDYAFTERGDKIGWLKGTDGKWHLTLFIECGRIKDQENKPIMTGLREIAKIHQGDFRLTPNQNLIIAGVAPRAKARIDKLAHEYGLIDDKVSVQREQSMSCVALPTCPLAMAEAERFLPELVTDVEKMLAKYGLKDEFIVLRVQGCPNGCGRAMLAEIGLVGKALGRYNLYVGGDREGARIPRLFQENATVANILPIIDGWIARWSKEREANEPFGDFALRVGITTPVVNSPRDFWQ